MRMGVEGGGAHCGQKRVYTQTPNTSTGRLHPHTCHSTAGHARPQLDHQPRQAARIHLQHITQNRTRSRQIAARPPTGRPPTYTLRAWRVSCMLVGAATAMPPEIEPGRGPVPPAAREARRADSAARASSAARSACKRCARVGGEVRRGAHNENTVQVTLLRYGNRDTNRATRKGQSPRPHTSAARASSTARSACKRCARVWVVRRTMKK